MKFPTIVVVSIGDWAIPFVVVSASFFLALYMRMGVASGIVLGSAPSIFYVVAFSAISYALADVLSDFIFPSIYTAIMGPFSALNIATILIGVGTYAWLAWRMRRTKICEAP